MCKDCDFRQDDYEARNGVCSMCGEETPIEDLQGITGFGYLCPCCTDEVYKECGNLGCIDEHFSKYEN